ncbi:MAG: hypothetical protein V4722_28715 [Bacteroidota bacterium]
MKLLFKYLFLVMLMHTSCTEKQAFFIGEVEYSYTYDRKQPVMDSLMQLKSQKSVFRFDNNNYQSKFIGQDTFTFFYAGALNKCISETNSKKDYTCEDYAVATDSIISFSMHDTDEKVLGHRCKIIEFQSKLFWTRYFVSTDLKIAPGTYQKHVAYNWKFCNEKTEGGLILKLEHRFENYTMKGIITSVIQQGNDFHALQLDEKTIAAICSKNN